MTRLPEAVVVDATAPVLVMAVHPERYSGKAHCATRPRVYRRSREDWRNSWVCCLTGPKVQGTKLAENQCSCPGVWNEALGDPRDMVNG